MSRSNYAASLRPTSIGSVIFVIDLYEENSPTMTVTNDAESVVTEVTYRYGGEYRIFYSDTEGQIDELVHDGEKFLHFLTGDPYIANELKGIEE